MLAEEIHRKGTARRIVRLVSSPFAVLNRPKNQRTLFISGQEYEKRTGLKTRHCQGEESKSPRAKPAHGVRGRIAILTVTVAGLRSGHGPSLRSG